MEWKKLFKLPKLTEWVRILFFLVIGVLLTDFLSFKLACDGDIICQGVQHLLTGTIVAVLVFIIIILLTIHHHKKDDE